MITEKMYYIIISLIFSSIFILLYFLFNVESKTKDLSYSGNTKDLESILFNHFKQNEWYRCTWEAYIYKDNIEIFNNKDLNEYLELQNVEAKNKCYYKCKEWFAWKLCNFEK